MSKPQQQPERPEQDAFTPGVSEEEVLGPGLEISEGDRVHYVAGDGQHLVADVVRVLDRDPVRVNLLVLADSLRRQREWGHLHRLEPNVPFGADGEPGTFHYLD